MAGKAELSLVDRTGYKVERRMTGKELNTRLFRTIHWLNFILGGEELGFDNRNLIRLSE